ncbi:MAG: beta-ketoacyl-[acyl-carrier-protein] synthase II, partial [Chloroflexota bacterium]|nr:beta-ketoacyl-[acyl-carrier-protein] synthase II [Chloroflexota bacterium]
MSGRRVVVSGLGAVTPAGNTASETWHSFVSGRSGVGLVTQFDTTDYPVKIGGEVKHFDASHVLSPREARNVGRFVQLAMVAAEEALTHAGLEVSSENAERVGVVLGSASGGLDLLLGQYDVLQAKGPRRVSPFY